MFFFFYSIWKFGLDTEQPRTAGRGGDGVEDGAPISTKHGGRALQSVSIEEYFFTVPVVCETC